MTADVPLWRLGNRNPNNLYRGEVHVGMLIDPASAGMIVQRMNEAEHAVRPAQIDSPGPDGPDGTPGHPDTSTATQEPESA